MSIDIPDAYLHIPMARPAWKYLWFMVNGRVFQFSLAISPWEFTKAARWLQGVKLNVYLDCWLIFTSSPVQANLVLQVLQHLRWVINFNESDLPPSQQFNFISIQFSMYTYIMANPEHAGSLEIAPSRHRQGSPQTFGHVDLYGHPSAERSALPPHNPVMGIRGLVSGDRVLVRQDFSHPDHSPSGGLVTLPCNAAGDLIECVRDREHSL